MAVPSFRKVPGKADLQNKDWTSSKAAVANLKSLEDDLKFNTKARGEFLNTRKKDADDLVSELEEVVTSFKSMTKRSAVVLPDLVKLKAKRTEVKSLMNDAKACEVAFFDALGSFRESGNFGLPEKVEALISKLRGATQTADKQHAEIPSALTALEARASAALKSISASMGAYDDDAKTVEKMKSLVKKLEDMQTRANTSFKRIESSIGVVNKYMLSKDKKLVDLAAVKSAEIAKDSALAKQFQASLKTGVTSVKTMHDSITDAGVKTAQARPLFDDANSRLLDVLTNMDKADKALSGLLKDKNLPKTVKAALPAGVK